MDKLATEFVHDAPAGEDIKLPAAFFNTHVITIAYDGCNFTLSAVGAEDEDGDFRPRQSGFNALMQAWRARPNSLKFVGPGGVEQERHVAYKE